MKLKTVLGVAVSMVLVTVLFMTQYETIKNTAILNEMKEIVSLNYQEIGNVYSRIKYLEETDKVISGSVNGFSKNVNKIIDNRIIQNKQDKFRLEKKLQQVSVIIYNETIGAGGSGVTLKYNGEFYILTAAHLLKENTDCLWICENGQKVCELEVVKTSDKFYKVPEGTDMTEVIDLLLLRPKNKEIQPKYYVELAEYEPLTAREVYVVGNPAMIEDVVADGRIAMYKENVMYLRAGIYFGNSGGGVYNSEGDLVGIVSFMFPIQNTPFIPPYTIDGTVRLNVIKEFLSGV